MQRSIRRSLSLAGAADALPLAHTPIQAAIAQEVCHAAYLGVMEINLKDSVQFTGGFKGGYKEQALRTRQALARFHR